MVSDYEQINLAQQIVRAGKFYFFLLGQIAQIEHTELTVRDHHSRGAGVLSAIRRRSRFGGAVVVSFACSRQWRGDVLPGGGENPNLHAFDRQTPSRFNDD